MSVSTATGGRVFTEQELVDIALDLLIQESNPRRGYIPGVYYADAFSSNDVRRYVRKYFGLNEIRDPDYISTAFNRASQAGRIRRTGRVVKATQSRAKGRMVTTWVPAD